MKEGQTILELAEEIMRQQTAKVDYMVQTPHLQVEGYDNNLIMRLLDKTHNDCVEPLDVGLIAHRQIGNHLGIPAKYYNTMLEKSPQLLAYNINHWFQNEPNERMIRTLDGKARAYLSNRYRRIDNHDIAEAVLPVIGEIEGARFESCQITDSNMYIKVVNPRLETEVVPGDIVQAGMVIKNSEVGQSAFSVEPLIYRLVCSNGMVVNDAAIRKNHVGRVMSTDNNFQIYRDETLAADDKAFMLKVQDTVRAAVDEIAFHKVVKIMREAKDAKLNTADVPGVVKLAARTFNITDNESEGVLQHLITGNDLSLYGLSNAVTRYSQDVDSYDRASDLESIGYNVLTMTKKQWQHINQAA